MGQSKSAIREERAPSAAPAPFRGRGRPPASFTRRTGQHAEAAETQRETGSSSSAATSPATHFGSDPDISPVARRPPPTRLSTIIDPMDLAEGEFIEHPQGHLVGRYALLADSQRPLSLRERQEKIRRAVELSQREEAERAAAVRAGKWWRRWGRILGKGLRGEDQEGKKASKEKKKREKMEKRAVK
ncbi:hypothetical protein LTR16_001606 [Cryomyces antarcticus]|uniref:Uncharacterized protein n=1 Tax=Cryomyces antarcticus TaxID=329879 RepID=A0ABR0KV72_9PEZI|nr:hypothetical protein LTR16_001606 [Cryomyces antarcticus]